MRKKGGQMNYITTTYSKHDKKRTFIYLDITDQAADHIFQKNHLNIKFDGKFSNEELPYIVVMCKVHNEDIQKFKNCMEELEKAITLRGYTKYGEFADNYFNQIVMAAMS